MKKVIITMDTEGDNLWKWRPGDSITTGNTLFLRRFQNMCEEYGFKPTWLTNYEMICDPQYLAFISDVVDRDVGELGMHLHAWNTPPIWELQSAQAGAPYLIEYPIEIMEEKIAFLHAEIKKRTGISPVSHRAGRWAMNQAYFELLSKYGYQIDCSVTPYINWESSAGQSEGAKGIDYSEFSTEPYIVPNTGILEIPVTILKSHRFFQGETPRRMIREAYHALKGQLLWFRPNGRNLETMLYVADWVSESKRQYLMFMLHSSELMPGGSPTFKTDCDIEKLYADLKVLFQHLSKTYDGVTLSEYGRWMTNERQLFG